MVTPFNTDDAWVGLRVATGGTCDLVAVVAVAGNRIDRRHRTVEVVDNKRPPVRRRSNSDPSSCRHRRRRDGSPVDTAVAVVAVPTRDDDVVPRRIRVRRVPDWRCPSESPWTRRVPCSRRTTPTIGTTAAPTTTGIRRDGDSTDGGVVPSPGRSFGTCRRRRRV